MMPSWKLQQKFNDFPSYKFPWSVPNLTIFNDNTEDVSPNWWPNIVFIFCSSHWNVSTQATSMGPRGRWFPMPIAWKGPGRAFRSNCTTAMLRSVEFVDVLAVLIERELWPSKVPLNRSWLDIWGGKIPTEFEQNANCFWDFDLFSWVLGGRSPRSIMKPTSHPWFVSNFLLVVLFQLNISICLQGTGYIWHLVKIWSKTIPHICLKHT